MARRAVPGHARVRGDVAAGRGRRAGGASGSTRCSTRRRRSTSATSGTRRPASPSARLPRRAAASARRSAASSGSGSSPGSNGLAAQGAREGLHASTSSAPPGSRTPRGDDYFPPRLMFPLADARGRVVGFQARKLRDDDPLRGEVREHARERALPQVAVLYGLHLARAAIAQAGPRRRRRGEHRRDRAAAGRASSRSSRRWARRSPSSSCGSSQRLTQRLYLCFDADAAGEDGDAARDGARDHAGLRRPRRDAAAGAGPGRRPAGLRGAAREGGELPRLPRPARARAHPRPPGGATRGSRSPRRRRGLAGMAGRAAARLDRLSLPQGDARPAHAEGRRADAHRGALAPHARARREAREQRARSLRRASRPRQASCRAVAGALRLERCTVSSARS